MLKKAIHFTPLEKKNNNKKSVIAYKQIPRKKSNFLSSLIGFIKYNNITVLILAIIFLIGTGVFAQTETGQAVIGAKEIKVEGVDNTLLLEADIDKIAMDFKIEKIESDEEYYHVTYTYIDLVKANNAWQYQVQEKIRKISRKLKEDLGEYLAEELGEEYEARIKELKKEQAQAQETGEKTRTEVESYSGLIGQTLKLADKIFSGYEAVKKRQIPSPSQPPTVLFTKEELASEQDDLTDIYNEYLETNDPDGDEVFGAADNCPSDYNPSQLDSDDDGVGNMCDLTPFGEEETEATSTPNEQATSTEEQTEETQATTTDSGTEAIQEEQTAGEEASSSTEEQTTTEEQAEEQTVEIIELPN